MEKIRSATKATQALIMARASIDSETAVSADEIGYMASMFVMATLPHVEPENQKEAYTRHNGDYTLLVSPGAEGIPYGTYPRLILCWLVTQIIRTQSREIRFGSLSEIMLSVGVTPSGGKNGTIGPFKAQLLRLSTCTFSISWQENKKAPIEWIVMPITSAGKLHDLAKPKKNPPAQPTTNKITISEEFFNQVINTSAPIDMRALRALKKSPLAIDLYIWSTYRVKNLKKTLFLSWGLMMGQFGTVCEAERSFRSKVKAAMVKVKEVYSDVNYSITKSSFILRPADTHIPQANVAQEIAAARAKTTLQTIDARKRGQKSTIKPGGKAYIGVAHDPFGFH